MKKKAVIIALVCIVAAICVAATGIIFFRIKAEETQKREELMYTRIGYCNDLFIDCDVNDLEYDEDKIKNFEIQDENGLYVRVSYYNFITGNNVSVERIIDSYRSFLDGDEKEAEDIRAFHIFRTQDAYAIAERKMTEDEFREGVRRELKELFGDDISIQSADREQLDEAIQNVILNAEPKLS